MKIEELYQKYLDCGCRISTDTRTLSGGEMFFALKGENFDGNAYAAKALECGASWVVTDSDLCPDVPGRIRVEDSFATLCELATWHREHVSPTRRLPVIGLTGTNGKTTTKELIREVLSTRYRVCATKGNLNNDIGVPLSLLSISPDTEIAVIEMGASHPDDISRLVSVSRPDCGLITNVGRAHLLGFGSFEGVKAAKGALYDYLAQVPGGFVFLNADDPCLCAMASERQLGDIRPYGLKTQGAEIIPLSPEEPFLRMKLSGRVISTRLAGSYNATNVLAAIAVGKAFGVSEEDAIRAIEAYVPSNNRSQMLHTARNTVIVDAYNANPSSMAAALENFASAVAPEKFALLGDMRELGEASLEEHIKVIEAVPSEVRIYLVGEEFSKAASVCGSRPDALLFPNSEALACYLRENPIENALVLLKGSRGTHMENILPEL
ncbi:MAG: UDP-N-acetylmuramoyl-tripeptide--D-alanyl-D-alanine ligase [Candidatus Cryptobacteroides sp.]|nr:UDP-N-acetylmuramoyl-tripeptide--D-alanyl-D-alanine ligase [Candidatus Cryptobacteroides sp.]